MSTAIHRQLNAIVGLAEGLNIKLPAAIAVLHAQLNRIDGFPAGNDNPKVSCTAELTSTENAAHRRTSIEEQIDALRAELHAAELVLRNLHRDCDRTIGTRHEVPRCDGGAGREGAIEWGRPDCWNVPSRGAICDACYHRERRWRKQHHLPTRECA